MEPLWAGMSAEWWFAFLSSTGTIGVVLYALAGDWTTRMQDQWMRLRDQIAKHKTYYERLTGESLRETYALRGGELFLYGDGYQFSPARSVLVHRWGLSGKPWWTRIRRRLPGYLIRHLVGVKVGLFEHAGVTHIALPLTFPSMTLRKEFDKQVERYGSDKRAGAIDHRIAYFAYLQSNIEAVLLLSRMQKTNVLRLVAAIVTLVGGFGALLVLAAWPPF